MIIQFIAVGLCLAVVICAIILGLQLEKLKNRIVELEVDIYLKELELKQWKGEK